MCVGRARWRVSYFIFKYLKDVGAGRIGFALCGPIELYMSPVVGKQENNFRSTQGAIYAVSVCKSELAFSGGRNSLSLVDF